MPDPECIGNPEDLPDLVHVHGVCRGLLAFCMTVDAGEITARGKTDTKVGNRPVIGICQNHAIIL
jgi:hypothetical protein